MNAETLKRIETLYDKWCNECPTQPEFIDVARDVMDHLPDLIACVKERDAAQKACKPLVEAVKALIAAAPHDGEGTRRALACLHGREALAHWEKVKEEKWAIRHKMVET